jgi:hypothetical protein
MFYINVREYRRGNQLEAQWAEIMYLTCQTNRKQELSMADMFANGSGRNEQSL